MSKALDKLVADYKKDNLCCTINSYAACAPCGYRVCEDCCTMNGQHYSIHIHDRTMNCLRDIKFEREGN